MAKLRCMNPDNLLTPPADAGTGIQPPLIVDASYVDCASPDGDLIDIMISKERPPAPNHQIDFYEVAIETAGGSVTIERLYFGPALGAQRRIQVAPSKTHRLRIRSVQRLKNQFRFGLSAKVNDVDVNFPPPAVGETVTEANGTTSVVTHVYDDKWCVVSNFVGELPDRLSDANVVITSGANDIYKLTPSHVPTATSGRRVETRSEWSPPFTVTPTAGSPVVQIDASKLTCLQGESVKFEANPSGFQTLFDLHKLHYKWTVTKAGEEGGYAALDATYWADEYGAGRNTRTDGYSRSWGFAPKTTGPVTVRCTVTDRKGNSAFDEVTITAVAPLDQPNGGFADAEIYAVSSPKLDVPGADNNVVNHFTDFGALMAALPSTGQALILIDVNGGYGFTQGMQYDFAGKVPDRVAIMPYNATDVGMAVGSRATIGFGFKCESRVQVFQGLTSFEIFDSTNPYTAYRPNEFINNDAATGDYQISVFDCYAKGWERLYVPPGSPTGYFVLNDFEMYDWLNFGLHGGDPAPHILVGVSAYHNPQAWRYKGKDENAWPADEGFFMDHPGYRSSRPKGARSCCKCYFATYITHSGDGYGQSQPAVRLFGNGGADFPYPGHFVESIFECLTTIELSCTANGGDRNFNAPGSNCFEKCVFHALGGFNPLGIAIAPASVINCKFTMNRDTGLYSDDGQFLSLNANSGAASIPAQNDLEEQPMWVENCTGYDTRADAQTSRTEINLWGAGSEPNNNISVENSIVYVPNLTTQPDLGVGLLSTVARYTPPYAGEYNWNDQLGTAGPAPTGNRLELNLLPENGSIDTSTAATDELSYELEPDPTSSAYASATGDVPIDDLYSRVRPRDGTSCEGAVCANAT